MRARNLGSCVRFLIVKHCKKCNRLEFMLDRTFKVPSWNLTAFCVTMQELNRLEDGVEFPVPCYSLNEVTGHKLPNCFFKMVTEVFFSLSFSVSSLISFLFRETCRDFVKPLFSSFHFSTIKSSHPKTSVVLYRNSQIHWNMP